MAGEKSFYFLPAIFLPRFRCLTECFVAINMARLRSFILSAGLGLVRLHGPGDPTKVFLTELAGGTLDPAELVVRVGARPVKLELRASGLLIPRHTAKTSRKSSEAGCYWCGQLNVAYAT